MEFLNPAALFGLLALPLLLIPYLIRRKPRRLVFSSLLLFLEGGAQASGRDHHSVDTPIVGVVPDPLREHGRTVHVTMSHGRNGRDLTAGTEVHLH